MSREEGSTGLRTPEDLVEIGFGRSRVVMMNEAHDGWRRCVRTREVGVRILPVAYGAGARHLAMEALWSADLAREANGARRAPEGDPREIGYLAQPEMRELAQAALDLGFELVHYEADFDDLLSAGEDPMGPAVTNRREEVQARNLARALALLPTGARMLVWCGNGHLYKAPGERWLPMGYRFRERAGVDPFAIDQVRTVAFPGLATPAHRALDLHAPRLVAMGGTAGWLTEEAPPDLRRDSEDAFLISVRNELE